MAALGLLSVKFFGKIYALFLFSIIFLGPLWETLMMSLMILKNWEAIELTWLEPWPTVIA